MKLPGALRLGMEVSLIILLRVGPTDQILKILILELSHFLQKPS